MKNPKNKSEVDERRSVYDTDIATKESNGSTISNPDSEAENASRYLADKAVENEYEEEANPSILGQSKAENQKSWMSMSQEERIAAQQKEKQWNQRYYDANKRPEGFSANQPWDSKSNQQRFENQGPSNNDEKFENEFGIYGSPEQIQNERRYREGAMNPVQESRYIMYQNRQSFNSQYGYQNSPWNGSPELGSPEQMQREHMAEGSMHQGPEAGYGRYQTRQPINPRYASQASHWFGSQEFGPQEFQGSYGYMPQGMQFPMNYAQQRYQNYPAYGSQENFERFQNPSSWYNTINKNYQGNSYVNPWGNPSANHGNAWGNSLNTPWNNSLNTPWAISLNTPWNNSVNTPWANSLNTPWNNSLNTPWANSLNTPWNNSLNTPWNNSLNTPWANSLNTPMSHSLNTPWANSLNTPWNNSLNTPMSHSLNTPWANSLNTPWANSLNTPWANSLITPMSHSLITPMSHSLNTPWANSLNTPYGDAPYNEQHSFQRFPSGSRLDNRRSSELSWGPQDINRGSEDRYYDEYATRGRFNDYDAYDEYASNPMADWYEENYSRIARENEREMDYPTSRRYSNYPRNEKRANSSREKSNRRPEYMRPDNKKTQRQYR